MEMTFILIDLVNSTNDLQLANRSWRPVAAEIKRSGAVTGKRADTLEHHLCTEIDVSEAKKIAKHLSQLIRAGTLPQDLDEETARRVADFASTSSGFEVC